MKDALRKKIIQEYYARRSKDYDRQKSRTWKTSQGFSNEVIDETISALTTFENKLVLEVGVGSGRNALPLMKKVGLQFAGVDLSKEMLTVAKGKMSDFKPSLSLILGDAEHLPFLDETFEGIICLSAMHYFTSQDKMLKRFSALLKRGGILVYGDLTVHESDEKSFLERLERILSKAHSQYYRPTEIQKLMKTRGFPVSKIKTIKYRKSYLSLIEDKGQYFQVTLEKLHRHIQDASTDARDQYELTDNEMTLYYTIITAQRAT